jgi:hypothetical protein
MMRNNLSTLLMLAGALIVWSFAAPAHAAVLDWSFDIVLSSGDSGTGTFVTQDTPVGGPYLITSIQDGYWDGSAMTLLGPVSGFNDNLLYPAGQPFDPTGLAFTADGVTWRIWLDNSIPSLVWCDTSSCSESDGTVLFSQITETTTPIPAALPLFGGGLGVIGFLARRRKRKIAAFTAARSHT